MTHLPRRNRYADTLRTDPRRPLLRPARCPHGRAARRERVALRILARDARHAHRCPARSLAAARRGRSEAAALRAALRRRQRRHLGALLDARPEDGLPRPRSLERGADLRSGRPRRGQPRPRGVADQRGDDAGHDAPWPRRLHPLGLPPGRRARGLDPRVFASALVRRPVPRRRRGTLSPGARARPQGARRQLDPAPARTASRAPVGPSVPRDRASRSRWS